SIDFLDIVFRLEREFGIKIPRDELFPDSILGDQADLVQEGRLTDRGMIELRSRMPYADLADFERDRHLSAVADLFTVALVVRYVAAERADPRRPRPAGLPWPGRGRRRLPLPASPPPDRPGDPASPHSQPGGSLGEAAADGRR